VARTLADCLAHTSTELALLIARHALHRREAAEAHHHVDCQFDDEGEASARCRFGEVPVNERQTATTIRSQCHTPVSPDGAGFPSHHDRPVTATERPRRPPRLGQGGSVVARRPSAVVMPISVEVEAGHSSTSGFRLRRDGRQVGRNSAASAHEQHGPSGDHNDVRPMTIGSQSHHQLSIHAIEAARGRVAAPDLARSVPKAYLHHFTFRATGTSIPERPVAALGGIALAAPKGWILNLDRMVSVGHNREVEYAGLSWTAGARKHRVSREQVRHVVEHAGLFFVRPAAPPERPDEGLLFVGDDGAGARIEVVGVEMAGGRLRVIHAMPMRPGYEALYEEAKKWRV
jgi:hypothetical protein